MSSLRRTRRAYDRFRQNPFDGLVVDARTTGEDGLLYFDRIATEADRQGISCGGILILAHDQTDWTAHIKQRPGILVLTDGPEHAVTMKQLVQGLRTLVPLSGNGAS